MNRLSNLSLYWSTALLCLTSIAPCRAQVTVGTAPISATAKIDWPTIYYAAIDVSSDEQGDHNLDQVLLGEDGKIVFSYSEDYEGEEDSNPADDALENVIVGESGFFSVTAVGGSDLHVCTWQNGQVVSNQSTKFRTHKTFRHEGNPDDEDDQYTRIIPFGYYGGALATLSGQIYGSKFVDWQEAYYYADGECLAAGDYQALTGLLFTGSGDSIQQYTVPKPPYVQDFFVSVEGFCGNSALISVSNNGTMLVETYALELVNPPPNEIYLGDYCYLNHAGNITIFLGGQSTWSVQNGCNLITNIPFQVNDNGVAIGESRFYNSITYPGYVWNGTYLPLHNSNLDTDENDDSPVDLNNSNQVVVKSAARDNDLNSGGYLWEGGTKTYLHSRLPKYLQAQVTDIQPLMISEKATDNTICVFGTVVEGDDWSYVLCTRDGAGGWSFAKAQMPEGYYPAAVNSSRELVAIADTTASTETNKSSHLNQSTASSRKAAMKGLGFQVATVSFGGSDYFQLESDPDSTGICAPYDAPQWSYNGTNNHNYAVSYPRGTTPQIGATIWTSDAAALDASKLKVKATGSNGITIPPSTVAVTLNADADDVLTLALTPSSATWPSTVKYYNASGTSAFKLDWQISTDGGTHWYPAGSTKHTVYITLAKSTDASNNEESLLYIGCKDANGLSSQTAVIDAIWRDFKGCKLYRKGSQKKLAYYGNKNYPFLLASRGIVSLLAHEDGRCGEFQQLMLAILHDQGVPTTVAMSLDIIPTTLYKNAAVASYKARNSDADPAYSYTQIREVFFIKKWSFTNDPWASTDQVGIGAQGNDNPLAAFSDHALVKIGTKIYDPSYGTGPFKSLLEWQDASVAGFGVIFVPPVELSSAFLYYIGKPEVAGHQDVIEASP